MGTALFDILKKNYEFTNVFKRGNSLFARELSLHYRKTNREKNRFGVTTVKNYGNVVKKNRKRRLIREAFRKLEPQCLTAYDIVVMGRVSDKESNFNSVYNELEYLLKKAKILDVSKMDIQE